MPQNHLAHETSPYLRQHAHNPVDWYPWGKTALNKAKQENKPILLSIGYAACHWCHVMAHESYEDPATAAIMNQHFVNIKVDREERPDLDKIYQTTHQLLNHRGGGWPLNVFLSSMDQTPFFSGTYFPKDPQLGGPTFKMVVRRLAEYYATHQAEITAHNVQLHLALQQLSKTLTRPDIRLNDAPIHVAKKSLNLEFDNTYGGFGTAPKFPLPSYLEFLLHYYLHQHDSQALQIVNFTLTKMAQSGIYDQVGGGFFRYSVDQQWMIPHFEKMLYDNAQLLQVYAQAYMLLKNPLYLKVIQQTVAWMCSEMQAKEGGFYATLDADSAGIEGQYYVWNKTELEKSLTQTEFALISRLYGLDHVANFDGKWHLHCYTEPQDALASDKLKQSALTKLFKLRQQRHPPAKDTKILCSWNALTIHALVQASIATKDPTYFATATHALELIHSKLWQHKRLLASYQAGQAKLNAYLDDYAFLLSALLSYLQVDWRNDYFTWSIDLAESLLTYFSDQKAGGFYFTANDHETLIQRPKPVFDEAMPSGNGIAALALLKLGYLSGEPKYIDVANKTLKMAWETLKQTPQACGHLLVALMSVLTPPELIVIRGSQKTITQWQEICFSHTHPQRFCYAIEESVKLPPLLQNYQTETGKTIAYICQGTTCLNPIRDLVAFEKHFAH